VARENAAAAGVAERVETRLGDLLEPAGELVGRIDLVVSNPPYVGASELPALEPEVRDHDPRAALVPPSGDRAEIYLRLFAQAAGALRPGGALAVEIGLGMEPGLQDALRQAGLRSLGPASPDLQGVPRVLRATR
jgi:release factor glutamine methyltransferase